MTQYSAPLNVGVKIAADFFSTFSAEVNFFLFSTFPNLSILGPKHVSVESRNAKRLFSTTFHFERAFVCFKWVLSECIIRPNERISKVKSVPSHIWCISLLTFFLPECLAICDSNTYSLLCWCADLNYLMSSAQCQGSVWVERIVCLNGEKTVISVLTDSPQASHAHFIFSEPRMKTFVTL